MESKAAYKVNRKENIYFYVRLFISLGIYYELIMLVIASFQSDDPKMTSVYIMVYFYIILVLLFVFFSSVVLIGHLKGNAIKLSKNQFPDIYQIVVKQSQTLKLNYVADVYIMQSGGILNAFATKFMGNSYIVLYSEIVESALEQDKNILEFIIGHELGHIKRNHMLKKLLLFPSYIIPFLGAAYSRACEYTCDNIGHFLSPSGVKGGLLLLASGRTLYKKVNMKEFIAQDNSEAGFLKWFAEKVCSHPNLTKRLALYPEVVETRKTASVNVSYIPEQEAVPVIETKEDDYSRYMPR
jgi:Zn-dependent protease with chaperone function